MAALATVGLAAERFRGRLDGIAYYWQALLVIVLGSFMVVLDTTIVNIALPRIIQVFQTDVNEAQLVLTAYMVALAVVMPATGYASDTFGAKRAYLVTLGLFTLGSALCGLALSVESLVFFRILQGLGGGMTMPLGMSLLFQVTPPDRRGTVMGVFGLPILVAPVIGPTLGGYLVEYVDWRWIFTLNIPVGVLAVLLGLVLLRETPRRAGTRFDWAGFLLSAVGFSAALLGLEKAPSDGWTAPHVTVLWLTAAITLPSWIVVELAQEHPLLDLTVLRDRTYSIAMLVSFVATIAMYSSLLLLPLFLQNVRGLGAMETGLLLFPQAIAAGVMMPISGRLLDRFGPRPLVVPGLLLLAYATWRLAALDLSTPDSTLRTILLLRGLAMGSMMMPVMTVAMDTIPPRQIARATALSNVLRQLYGAFGTGIFASLLLDRQRFHQAALAQVVNPDNIEALRILSAAKLALLQSGLSETTAHAASLLALSRQVNLAATVRAFDDCFYLAAWIALLGIVPAVWLKRGRAARAGHRAAGPIID